MRKLSLKTEIIAPLNGASVSETDAIVGGTSTPCRIAAEAAAAKAAAIALEEAKRIRDQMAAGNWNVQTQGPCYSQGGNCTKNNIC